MKIKFLVTIGTNVNKKDNYAPYKLTIASSIREFDGIPIAQIIMDFITTYQRILGIYVDDVRITSDPDNAQLFFKRTTKRDFCHAEITFEPSSVNSNIYKGPVEIPMTKDFSLEISDDEFTITEFNMFLLNSYDEFTKERNNKYEDKMNNGEFHYDCIHVKINGIEGYVIENIPSEYREYVLYDMMYYEKNIENFHILGLAYDDDINVPTKLKNSMFTKRYGWFVYVGDKSPLSTKKGIRDSLTLTKKNYRPNNETTDWFSLKRFFDALLLESSED